MITYGDNSQVSRYCRFVSQACYYYPLAFYKICKNINTYSRSRKQITRQFLKEVQSYCFGVYIVAFENVFHPPVMFLMLDECTLSSY